MDGPEIPAKPVIDAATAALLTPQMKKYSKRVLTRALRIKGPFTVVTREGELDCPDGWLALDASDQPCPIAADEFPKLYELPPTAEGE